MRDEILCGVLRPDRKLQFGALQERYGASVGTCARPDRIWCRRGLPGLSKGDRRLITCAALVALNRTEQQPGHFARAFNNGVTRDELAELITHLAFYSGWPTAMSAANVARKVIEDAETKWTRANPYSGSMPAIFIMSR